MAQHNKLSRSKEIRSIPCNLPAPEHKTLLGRQNEIAELIKLLSFQYGVHLISVDGIGGVGKTALVLEVAYRCWRASTGESPDSQIPTFEAIIFVSAKQEYLTPAGILRGIEAQRTLRLIFREIAQTLNRFDIKRTTPDEQIAKVRDALSRQRTLLIVDNLETMVEKQEILAFLFRLPPQVKVVITTRERTIFSPIRLEQLSQREALKLIEQEAAEKEILLSEEQTRSLYRHLGGIPAALTYALGQIASGYSIETVLARIPQAHSDVARFCFEGAVEPLRGQKAHQLLMAAAMFPKTPTRAAIAYTAGLVSDPFAVEEGLAQLRRLSLVNHKGNRYSLLPLTREYALAELAVHAGFERAAREGWVTWYLNFSKEYGGKDWAEWHIQFDLIEEEWENLLAVFDWCAVHDQYDHMKAFWLAGGVSWFAYTYGYWDDRIIWLSWLIQAAEGRGDWSTAVEAIMDKGHTLTLMDRLEEADKLMSRAWPMREHAHPRVKMKLSENIARLRTYQQNFTDAHDWLDQTEALLDTVLLDEPELSRRRITIQNYRGRLFYETQDYSRAEMCFRAVLEGAQHIGFQRGIIYAQKFLADIAIKQGRLDEAESMLQEGLTVSERNKDKRRVAFYKSSFARLYYERGDPDQAHHWAAEARKGFEQLGMHVEEEEMHVLLQEMERAED